MARHDLISWSNLFVQTFFWINVSYFCCGGSKESLNETSESRERQKTANQQIQEGSKGSNRIHDKSQSDK